MNNCERCGITQDELPVDTQVINGEEVEARRFALEDKQRGMLICTNCLPMYQYLLPLSTEYPMLADLPELRAGVFGRVPVEEHEFFARMLPNRSL